MPLFNLLEWNEARTKEYELGNIERQNGIACPQCKIQLYDKNPLLEIKTFPPLLQVYCKKCGFEGTRIK